jgi:hypothetical protein
MRVHVWLAGEGYVPVAGLETFSSIPDGLAAIDELKVRVRADGGQIEPGQFALLRR